MPRKALIPLVVAAPIALGAAGCGAQPVKTDLSEFKGDQRPVAEAAAALAKAASDHDFRRVCGRSLTRELGEKISRRGHRPCPETLRRTASVGDSFDFKPVSVKVDGDRATVVVETTLTAAGDKRKDSLGFVRVPGGRWQLADLTP